MLVLSLSSILKLYWLSKLNNYGKALEKAESELQSFWQEFEVISMFDGDRLQDELNRIEESRRDTQEKIRLEYETKEEFFA